jgi:hypothetical protein
MNMGDFAVFLVLAAIVYWVTTILLNDATAVGDKRSLLIGSGGLVLSVLTVYITTIKSFFRKPRLAFSFDSQRSEPTESGGSGTWFYRLRVENYGLTKAKDCVGRLVEIWTGEGEPITKFDPLPLYWARQNKLKINDKEEITFKPIDIQGYRDFDFLDLAQVTDNFLTLRVVIPPLLVLTRGADSSASPGNMPILKLPGTYYARIGLHAEDASASPILVKIVCSDLSQLPSPTSSPCELIKARRLPRKRDGG